MIPDDLSSMLEVRKEMYHNCITRNETEDFQLQRSAQLEYGNSLPNDKKKKIDNPFKLDGNEVVISYKENNKTKYFKYSNLTEGEQVLYK